jgi:hypothetical protein
LIASYTSLGRNKEDSERMRKGEDGKEPNKNELAHWFGVR